VPFFSRIAWLFEPSHSLDQQPPAEAPAVHVQPRAEDFYPHSPASEAEQHRLSEFDAEQQKLDQALDRKLNICRC
jgi:hypothetical protein